MDRSSSSGCASASSADLNMSSKPLDPLVSLIPLHCNECLGLPADIERMRDILLVDPGSLHRVQRHGSFIDKVPDLPVPLHCAIVDKHKACVLFLIEAGAQVNQCRYITTLFLASHAFDTESLYEVVQCALKHGAAPNCHGFLTKFLNRCINLNQPKLVKLLLENGAVTEDFERMRNRMTLARIQTPLYLTIQNEDTKILTLLLLHGAVVDLHNLKPFDERVDEIRDISFPHYIVDFYLRFDGSWLTAQKQLEIVHQFGGQLWVRSGGLTALQYLQQVGDTEEGLRLAEELKCMMQNPLSLQSLCRLAVKRALGREYWRNIQLLHLPREVKNFLLYFYYMQ